VSSSDFVRLVLQLTAMLAVAMVFGQVMRRLRQPAVVGEMFGGILLGPTVLGVLAPAAYAWLFLASDDVTVVRDATTKLGMLFFLFLAGLDVDLSALRSLGRCVLLIGLSGTLLPIAIGAALVHAVPLDFWGELAQAHLLAFTLFIGMNLANSANPVIARVLLDLGLLRQPIGTLIMSATVIDDLVNWTLFAIVLSDLTPSSRTSSIVADSLMVLAFCALVLGGGRWVARPALRWVRERGMASSGFVAFAALLVLLAGAAAEAIGVHAFLGAFLVGAALGGGDGDRIHVRNAIEQFVMSFFAPLYFIAMGMSANFVQHFDWTLVVLICVVGCISKIGAVLLGARAAGMPLNREAWAIAFGLNARGATGVILAGVGLANGVIDQRMFVAMVCMAIATSLLSGPMMAFLLAHRRRVPMGQLAAATE
jgi:Kef-type K+ transport system membrane component KefB